MSPIHTVGQGRRWYDTSRVDPLWRYDLLEYGFAAMWRYHLLEHGYQDLLVAFVLLFILFGHRLPRMMRALFQAWA